MLSFASLVAGDDDGGDGDAGDVGPSLPAPKKRRTLEFEAQYLDALPSGQMYERSYMHKDHVTHAVWTRTDFLITASVDGYLYFWKKKEQDIEFVKKYRAHLGSVDCLVASADGSLCASLSHDGSLKASAAECFLV